MIQIAMLKAMERTLGKPLNEMFDLICGTSIGSCIGVCVSAGTNLDTSMELLEGLCYAGCDTCPKAVFKSKSTWRLLRKGYRVHEDVIHRYMEYFLKTNGYEQDQALPSPKVGNGAASTMPHFFSIATQEQGNGTWLPFVHSNYPRDAQGFTVAGKNGLKVGTQLCASTAAPTYFPAVIEDGVQYVDGGISANNPSLIALQEARAIWPGRPIGCVVSLGTGRKVAAEQSQSGLTYWAGKMLSMPTDTYRVHKEVEALLPGINGAGFAKACYCRLDPVIPNIHLDENRKYVLDEMIKGSIDYISAKASKVNRTSALLNLLSGESVPHPSQVEQVHYLSEQEVQNIIKAAGGSPCSTM